MKIMFSKNNTAIAVVWS